MFGVCYYKRDNLWVSSYTKNGTRIIKSFKTKEEAISQSLAFEEESTRILCSGGCGGCLGCGR